MIYTNIMAHYISLDINHTPLDILQLQEHYDRKNPPKNRLPGRKISSSFISNSLLVFSVTAFVLVLTYAFRADFLSTKSRASESKPSPKVVTALNNPVLKTVKDYPQKYNEETIPKELYYDIKQHYAVNTTGRKNYVIDKIVRFYIYRDVLKENELTYPESKKETPFAKMIEDVSSMEKVLKNEVINKDGVYKTLDDVVTSKIKNFK